MSVPKHWLLGEWYLQRLIVHQERYSLTDSNENVGIKLSADDTFLEYDYYCRLPVLSCFQIPVIADLPVGENLQDHVSVDIRIFTDVPTINPSKQLDRRTIEQYFYQRKGKRSLNKIINVCYTFFFAIH
jgi:hypothetical protein